MIYYSHLSGRLKSCQSCAQLITEIVSGSARGVDKEGEVYAATKSISVKRFPAEWNKYGKSAGMIRNTEMAKYADCLVAIWDGKSRGTKHMIETMTKMNKPVHVTIL